MKKEFICIVCPQSCRLSVEEVDGEINVEGYSCKRGITYGKNEYLRPMRLITTTVSVKDGVHRRLPVVSNEEVPKDKVKEVIKLLHSTVVTAPIVAKDVIVEDVGGTGVSIIASRSLKHKEE